MFTQIQISDKKVDDMMDGFMATWAAEGDLSTPMAQQEDVFPVALGFFGSAFAMMKVI